MLSFTQKRVRLQSNDSGHWCPLKEIKESPYIEVFLTSQTQKHLIYTDVAGGRTVYLMDWAFNGLDIRSVVRGVRLMGSGLHK